MTKPLTEAETLAHHQRRRRWIVRITLGSVLVLLLLALAGLALTSSGMSIEEAREAYKHLRQEHASLAQAERLFGRPLINPKYPALKVWFFTESSSNSIKLYAVCKNETEEESVWMDSENAPLTGWDAWKFRWWLFKLRLGFSLDEYPI
ncbi:MAG: hypothetical protein QM703_13690 [Gemmatales bacterium]